MEYLAFFASMAATYVALIAVDRLGTRAAYLIDLLFAFTGLLGAATLFAWDAAYLDAITIVQREFSASTELVLRATGVLAEQQTNQLAAMISAGVGFTALWRLPHTHDALLRTLKPDDPTQPERRDGAE